jgi:hypothetical protein
MISNGDFVGVGTGTNPINFSVTTVRNRAGAITLGNNDTNVATATFVVPSDYVAGQSIPKMTIYWGTDDGGANRRVDMDISFTLATNITSPTSNVTFRYNIRDNSGASTNAADSLNPAQGAIVGQTIPEGSENYDNSPALWQPGDIIVISIGRNGPSGSDPNSGNVYLYGVSFDYNADQ